MKLHRKEFCPFTSPFSAAAESQLGRNMRCGWEYGGLRTHITHGDIGNCDHRQKCGNS